MIRFILSILLSAGILSILPFSKYTKFQSCIIVSILNAVFLIPISFAGGIFTFISSIILSFIPFIGGIINYFIIFFIVSILSSISLKIADSIVEDFEIKGILNTIIAAFFIGFGQSILSFFY